MIHIHELRGFAEDNDACIEGFTYLQSSESPELLWNECKTADYLMWLLVVLEADVSDLRIALFEEAEVAHLMNRFILDAYQELKNECKITTARRRKLYDEQSKMILGSTEYRLVNALLYEDSTPRCLLWIQVGNEGLENRFCEIIREHFPFSKVEELWNAKDTKQ